MESISEYRGVLQVTCCSLVFKITKMWHASPPYTCTVIYQLIFAHLHLYSVSPCVFFVKVTDATSVLALSLYIYLLPSFPGIGSV